MANLLAGTAYIDVLPNMDKFGRTLESKFNSIGDSLTSAGKKLTTRLTLPLVAFGAAAVKEASEAAVVARQTEAALASSGNAAVLTSEQVAGVSASIMEMAAIDDEAAQKTANLLVQMTDLGRYGGQADDVLQQMTTTVYDMSAATGRSETFFVRLMAQIQNTPAKAIPALVKMGVISEEQGERFKQMAEDGEGAAVSTELLAAANEKYAGQAEAAVTPQQEMAIALGEMSETIGTFLLPFIEKLTDLVQGWIEKFQQLSPQTQKVVVFVGVLLAALGPLLMILGQLSNGIALVGTALKFLAANPIVLVLILIAGLAYLVWKNWDKIKEVFFKVWEAIKTAATNIYDAIKKFLVGVVDFVIGAWKAYLDFWMKLPGRIAGFLVAIYDKVKQFLGGVVDWVRGKWDGLVSFFSNIPGRVASAFGRVKDAIVNAFKAAVNFVIGAWNSIDFGIHIRIPDWVPFVGGKGFDVDDIFPDIPMLARGGIVRQPTLAMVGEAGPEAVIPLSRMGGQMGTLRIVDWRRGLAELDWELDRLGMVAGD